MTISLINDDPQYTNTPKKLKRTSQLQLTISICDFELIRTINSGSPKHLGKERDDLIRKRDKAKTELILLGKSL